MASSINPSNIDGTYPVAGQDNNSQGFRDNFTNTKVNFQYAEDEINDLETNVLLKAALTGETLNNNMNNNTIYAVNLDDVSTTRIALPNTSGSISVNYASGQYQTVAPSAGSSNITVTNWPAAGFYGSARVAITVSNIAYTVTFNATTTLLGTTGLQGYTSTSAASGYITFAANGVYVFDLSTNDGGSIVTITDLSRPLTVFTGNTITGALRAPAGTVSAPSMVVGVNDNGQYEVSSVQQGFSIGNSLVGGYNASGLFTGNIDEQIVGVGVTVDGVVLVDGTVRTLGFTVATLPAGTVGQRAYVTDATTPTYNGALVGGGAVTVPVFRNATAWVSA